MDFQLIKNNIVKNKVQICKNWYQKLISSYPGDSTKFLDNIHNQFGNPMAYTFNEELLKIFDCITENNFNDILIPLENIIKIRAVQDFKPSEALSFIFQFKEIINVFANESKSETNYNEAIEEFNNRIDRMALIAFEIYVTQKQRIAEIKINDEKKRFSRIIDKINEKYELFDK